MDWQQYEREIEKEFREAYPSSRVTPNAKLAGKFSKIERQIDLLIEEQASDFSFRIIVDAKYRGRKIDVGDVEAFLGLTRDVEAHTGMMVTVEGYTEAAINRAHYDDLDVILEILNFDDLKSHQGLTAIPYAGEHGARVNAPFGWIIDATKQDHMSATLYQRGLSLDEAKSNREWMYINLWNKHDKEINDLDALLKYQETYIRRGSQDAEIRILEGTPNQRAGARTLIRALTIKKLPGVVEYTGFVDFEDYIFICVLFTPVELEAKNLRKLRFVLRDVFPISLKTYFTAAIKMAHERLEQEPSDDDKAQILAQIGRWHRQMNQLQEARQSLEKSLELIPLTRPANLGEYETMKQLVSVLLALTDKNAAIDLMGRLLRLDPHNPTVFNDCIDCARSSPIGSADLVTLFENLQKDYADDQHVHANCEFYIASILIGIDPASAKKRMIAVEQEFRNILPPDHHVFTALSSALRSLS